MHPEFYSRIRRTLVVVCFPSSRPTDRSGNDPKETIPFLLHFNSLRRTKPHILRRIKLYLEDEWKRRRESASGARDFQDLKEITPVCPQQRNLSDCGVFVLEYLERLLLAADSPLLQVDALIAGAAAARCDLFRGWFTPKDVAGKRAALRDLICGSAA